MKKSSLSYFVATLVAVFAATTLSFGGVAVRAQQTQQTDQSDTTTKSKSKSKSKSRSKSADTAASATPAATAAAPTPAPKSAPASTSTPAAATSPTPSPAPAAVPSSKPAPAPKPAAQQQTPVAHSAGTVWVNTDSGVYHKPGTRWYGKTKQGKYMTEADAQKAGYRAAAKE
jgi:hypothetical protein